MARTFIAFDPISKRRRVIIEVRPDLVSGATDADIHKFEQRLFEGRVGSGLLVTPSFAYFILDTLATLMFSTKSYEVGRLDTGALVSRTHSGHVGTGEALHGQVKTWLDAVAGSWSTFVPDEALPFMLPEMVGRLADSNLQEWDDVLELGDAAE